MKWAMAAPGCLTSEGDIAGLHRRWVVRRWQAGASEGEMVVFDDDFAGTGYDAALKARDEAISAGLRADGYQMLSAGHGAHCGSETRVSGRCYCQCDE